MEVIYLKHPTQLLAHRSKSLQLRLTLHNTTDPSPPSSSVRGILQARTLEWVAMPPPGDLPYPGIEPCSHVSCIGEFFTTSASWETLLAYHGHSISENFLPHLSVWKKKKSQGKIFSEANAARGMCIKGFRAQQWE